MSDNKEKESSKKIKSSKNKEVLKNKKKDDIKEENSDEVEVDNDVEEDEEKEFDKVEEDVELDKVTKNKKDKKNKKQVEEENEEEENEEDEKEEEDEEEEKEEKKKNTKKNKVVEKTKPSKVEKTKSKKVEKVKAKKVEKTKPKKVIKKKEVESDEEEEEDENKISLEMIKKTSMIKSNYTTNYIPTKDLKNYEIKFDEEGFKDSEGISYLKITFKNSSINFRTKEITVKPNDFCVRIYKEQFKGKICFPLEKDPDLLNFLKHLNETVIAKLFGEAIIDPEKKEEFRKKILAKKEELKKEYAKKKNKIVIDPTYEWKIGDEYICFEGGLLTLPGIDGRAPSYIEAYTEETEVVSKRGKNIVIGPKFSANIHKKKIEVEESKSKKKLDEIPEEILTKLYSYKDYPFPDDIEEDDKKDENDKEKNPKKSDKKDVMSQVKEAKKFRNLDDVKNLFSDCSFTCVLQISYSGICYHKFGISHQFKIKEIYLKNNSASVESTSDFKIED